MTEQLRNGFKPCPWETDPKDPHALMCMKVEGFWQVHCLSCGAAGPANQYRQQTALNLWNKRPKP